MCIVIGTTRMPNKNMKLFNLVNYYNKGNNRETNHDLVPSAESQCACADPAGMTRKQLELKCAAVM
jgi:hypothetical protein